MIPEDENEETPSLGLRFREVKGVIVIDMEGQIDLNASELIELIGWLLKRGKRKIVLNFEQVDLLDYHGLSVLAIAYKNVINHEGRMKFIAVPLHIEKLFHISHLLEVFELHESLEIALGSFDEKKPSVQLLPLRRRFKRLEISNFDVHYIPVYRKGDPTFEGKAVNLGGEGLFLHAKKVFPLNTELLLELQLGKESPPVSLRGMVIWHADQELQPHQYPGMGIQFSRLDTHQQQQLITFIERNMTQRSGEEKHP
ncbi:MAG: PilZ domain-containing protein [Candidatus Omnitrophota bacterium]